MRIAAIHRAGLICVCAMLVAASPAAGQNATDKVDAALRSSLAEQREWALDQIIETHDARPGLTPRLAQLLDDSDLDVAGKAATALSLRGVDAFPAIDELLKTGSAQQRWGATVALYKSTADIARFLPTLTKQLSAEDELLVRASLAALARLQSRAAPAVSALKPLLSHDDSEIRWATLTTLASIGPAARDAVPSIEPILRDKSVELHLAAADALRRIDPPVPLTSEEIAARIDWMRLHVPELMQQYRVPGVSIAIVQKGRVSWAQAFGVRDVRDRKPVTVDTVFEACSMSKPILGLVALQLVQDGRLDLDRPLVEYLGHDYLPDQPEHRRVTARMSLTHRTGFTNWRVGYNAMGGPLPLELPPGSEYTYSGEGIVFLQRALEAITGSSLERLSQDGLFAPLGLEHTSFAWTEAIEKDLASGHRADGTFKERTRYRKGNGAYSLYTTPTEYARLMMTLMRPEVLGKRSFTRASIDMMLERELRLDDDEAVSRPGRARSVATYRGLAWKLDVTREGDIVWHSGSNSSGFKSFGQFNPLKQSGLLIFTNGEGGSRLREVVVKQVGDL